MPGLLSFELLSGKIKMNKNKKDEPTLNDLYEEALDIRKRYSHSHRKLYKAILGSLPPLGSKEMPDAAAVKIAIKAGKIMKLLGRHHVLGALQCTGFSRYAIRGLKMQVT